MTEEKLKQFLTELSILSNKHKIYIGGCGCCHSPYLNELETGKTGEYTADKVSFDDLDFKII